MTAVRLGLVANTKSGAADRATQVEDRLRAAGADVELLPLDAFCDGPESVDSERLAAVASRLRADRLVAAGGDGTLGPASLLALKAGLPLAVVPVGTANSFARWMDIPLGLDDAAALAARPGGPTRRAEVASADGRPYVNVAATGLSVLAAHRARPLKKRLGPLAYAVGAARAATTGRPLTTTVVADGREVWSGEAWQVLVAATGAFGGESSTGGVDTDDEFLDVAIVPAGSRLKLARRALAMRRGRLVHEDEVVHERGRDVRLDVGGHPSFNVDGEVLDLAESRFTVLGRIDVVVPS
jgi:diacylglycerol kinase family enzyme